jgi:hypothetical protein
MKVKIFGYASSKKILAVNLPGIEKFVAIN